MRAPTRRRTRGQRELKEALAFGTEHLSLYQLTIEPGTAYATLARQGKLAVPDEDTAAELYEATQEICARVGLRAYEVSNHAKPGAESRHNLIYWRYGDYAGVGPGAHGRLTLDGRRMATEAERLPEKWLAAVEERGSSIALTDISLRRGARESADGLAPRGRDRSRRLSRARGASRRRPSQIADLGEAGLDALDGETLRATARGRLVLNAVIAQLAEGLTRVA